jgi:hypothetical protein
MMSTASSEATSGVGCFSKQARACSAAICTIDVYTPAPVPCIYAFTCVPPGALLVKRTCPSLVETLAQGFNQYGKCAFDKEFWKQLELPARVKYMRAPHLKMFVETLIASANDDHDRRLGDSIAKRIKSLKQMITSLKAEIREFKAALPKQIQVRSIDTHKASWFCEKRSCKCSRRPTLNIGNCLSCRQT